jgi:hypothetical protein
VSSADQENFVENFSKSEWLRAIRDVRAMRAKGDDMGMIASTEFLGPCEGGFCKRHGIRVREAQFVCGWSEEPPARGHVFCQECAIIWATKVFLKCKVQWPD